MGVYMGGGQTWEGRGGANMGVKMGGGQTFNI